MTSTTDPARRIRWKCRRGMLELDMLFEKFLNEKYSDLSQAEQDQFQAFLEVPDPVLWGWLLGHEKVTESKFIHIVSLISASHK